MALSDTLTPEAEVLVERHGRGVVREHVKLELPDSGPPSPVGGGLKQCPADPAATMRGRDHETEVGDVRARGMRVPGQREPAHDQVAVGRDEDGRVRIARDRAQVAPLLADAAPRAVGDEPALWLAADRLGQLHEGGRVARPGAPYDER